jgi:hypothetical protein
MTTVADGLYQFGGMPVMGGIPPFLGKNAKVFFVDPVNGSDGNPGNSPARAFASLYRAHYMMTAGQNDVCFLLGNGATSGTARLSLANALAAQGPTETAATSGELVWSKDACHLIGIAAPGTNSRARIATPTGTYTAATFGSNNMMTVSADGCYFANFSLTQSFSTGNAAEITLTVSGERNVFNNVYASGGLRAAAYGGAASRALLVTGGENEFFSCDIGADTVTRSAANANLSFTSAAARNRFVKCLFAMHTSSATSVFVLADTGGVDRWTLFDDCMFINAMDSGSTAITGAFSLAASIGGSMVVKNSGLVGDGAANWGIDATSLAQMYVDNVGGAATAGLMLNPT